MTKKKPVLAEIAAEMPNRGTISAEQQEAVLREALADPVIVGSIQRAISEPHPVDEDGAPKSFNPTLTPGHEAFRAIIARIAPHGHWMDQSRLWATLLGDVEQGARND